MVHAKFKLYATTSGIFPIFACHSLGPMLYAQVQSALTVTMVNMHFTSNS